MYNWNNLTYDEVLEIVGAVYRQALEDVRGEDYATPQQMRNARVFIDKNPYNIPDEVITELRKEVSKCKNV